MKKFALMAATASAVLAGCAVRDAETPSDAMTRDLTMHVRDGTVDEEARTVELSFSSEEPYGRWWGEEILDHAKSSVRLGRLNGGAAVLVNHDTREQVGVVEKAWVKGKKGRAIVRFGKSQSAEDVFQDIIDGIRTLVSVGYRIHEIILEKSGESGDTYRVEDWEPYEISIVSVPADTTVGVGRTAEAPTFDPRTLIEETDDMNMQRDGSDNSPSPAPTPAPTPAVTPAPTPTVTRGVEPTPIDPAEIGRDAVVAERGRIANITAMAARANCAEIGAEAVREGITLEAFVELVESRMGAASPIVVAETADIGLGRRELANYSFVRLMNAIANPTNARAQEAAAFEIECSNAAQEGRTDAENRGFTIPVDVMRTSLAEQRDLNVTTATAGGHTVATDLLAASFIEILRNRMALVGIGATVLTDLVGNLAIPRATGGATAYWVAESASPSESAAAFDQVALTPKTIGAFSDMSRKLLLQSSIDVEAFVRGDIALALALGIDLAGIAGTGADDQPTGILNTSGIGDVAGGTNGLDPTWAHIINLETEVAIDNADIGNMGYLTNAKARGKLKQTEKFSGTNGNPIWSDGNELNGYNAAASNQVPADLDKGTSTGVCSAILFGNFSDLIIGMWGGLDILADPFTGSTAGTVRIVGLQDVDVAVRHAESFAAMQDALTV